MEEKSREENVRLNRLELQERQIVLRSTPRLVTLGTHNRCNAKCVFCLEGAYDRFSLEHYRRFFETRMGPFIRRAERVTFTGFGELLWIPGIEEILDYLNETLPDTDKIVTTNGTPLRPPVIERLAAGRYIVQVSLHASTAALHEELTGLSGEFERVLAQIRELAHLRRGGARLGLELVDILTTRNIDDLPEFIRLAFELGVPNVRCQHLTLFLPEHVELSCFFDPARANAALGRARAAALLHRAAAAAADPSWDFRVSLPEPFGSTRTPRPEGVCADPWEHVYVELQGTVQPCCYWGEHIGDLNRGDELEALWNGPLYASLREGMASGRPHPWCSSCVRYRGYNVDDLSCHVTTRPDARKRVLAEVGRRFPDLASREGASKPAPSTP